MKSRLAIAIGIVAALSIIAGAAYALTDGGVVIHACVKDNGQVRIVNEASECKAQETHIFWNITGPQGQQGQKGDKGDPGAPGAAGAQGPAGSEGDTGPAGPDGAVGPQGQQGADGAPGLQGPMGATGPKGDIGPAGPVGGTGPAGPAGASGPQGPQGEVGPQGPKGADGIQGLQGEPGSAGPQGEEGPVGPAGPQGAAGEQGPPGGGMGSVHDLEATPCTYLDMPGHLAVSFDVYGTVALRCRPDRTTCPAFTYADFARYTPTNAGGGQTPNGRMVEITVRQGGSFSAQDDLDAERSENDYAWTPGRILIRNLDSGQLDGCFDILFDVIRDLGLPCGGNWCSW
jgi:hypothetical protein